VSAREIQQLRFVPFPSWFPAARDPRAGARFYTVVQEDIYEALVRSESQFREHRVIDLEILGNVVGADIRQYFTYFHGLPELLALPGTYCEQWVREFYASVWVSPDHSYIHYALAGRDYRVTAQRTLFQRASGDGVSCRTHIGLLFLFSVPGHFPCQLTCRGS